MFLRQIHHWLNLRISKTCIYDSIAKKKKKKSPIFVVFHQKAVFSLTETTWELVNWAFSLGKKKYITNSKIEFKLFNISFFLLYGRNYLLCKKTFQYKEKKPHILIDLIFSPNFWPALRELNFHSKRKLFLRSWKLTCHMNFTFCTIFLWS